MMTWVTWLSLPLALSLFGAKGPADWTPSHEQVMYVEKQIRLPEDAPATVEKYNRYYTGVTDEGRRMIYAEYVFIDLLGPSKPSDGTGHVYIVNENKMPQVTNGGCGVVTFYYDLHRDYTPSMLCNAVGEGNAP
jgi:hypothetical protein